MSAERELLDRLREGYNELKSQLHNCPESLREQLQEQLRRVSASHETRVQPPRHIPKHSKHSGCRHNKPSAVFHTIKTQLLMCWVLHLLSATAHCLVEDH